MIYEISLIISALILNLTLLKNFSKIKIFFINMDNPDHKRKIHSKPTALAGGTLIIINLILYCFLNYINIFFNLSNIKNVFFEDLYSLGNFLIFSICIFFIGFFDDKYNLSANLKFVLLTILITIFLILDNSLQISNIKLSFLGTDYDLNKLSIYFTIFCYLVYLNAFNMFDGINLQSSLHSILILSFINLCYYTSIFLTILIISLIFFSILNFKNKAFLGDSGTLLLGFIISYIFIKLYNTQIIYFADSVVIFMIIPGLDLIRLFILRLLNKNNPLKPDRNHLHHLLIKKLDMTKTLMIISILIFLPMLFTQLKINNFHIIISTIIVYMILIYATKRS